MECKACGHKHDVWNGETLELEYQDTESFLSISGNYTMKIGEGYNMRWVETGLVACPKCGTVRVTETF